MKPKPQKWNAKRNVPIRLGEWVIRVSRKVVVTATKIRRTDLDDRASANVK